MPPRGELFKVGGADVPDEPEALRAAGLCGARNRPTSKWRFCHKAKLRGRPRCRRHGGKSLRGPAAPAWGRNQTTGEPSRSPVGKYSGILKGAYAEAYAASLGAGGGGVPDLSEQIALCDARERRIVEMVEARRVERGETGKAWQAARAHYHAARKAGRAGDADAFNRCMEDLGGVILPGADEEDAWDELRANSEARRKLVATQRQVLGVSEGYLPKATLRVVGAQLLVVLQQAIPDRRTLDLVATKIDLLMTEVAGQPLEDLGEEDGA